MRNLMVVAMRVVVIGVCLMGSAAWGASKRSSMPVSRQRAQAQTIAKSKLKNYEEDPFEAAFAGVDYLKDQPALTKEILEKSPEPEQRFDLKDLLGSLDEQAEAMDQEPSWKKVSPKDEVKPDNQFEAIEEILDKEKKRVVSKPEQEDDLAVFEKEFNNSTELEKSSFRPRSMRPVSVSVDQVLKDMENIKTSDDVSELLVSSEQPSVFKKTFEFLDTTKFDDIADPEKKIDLDNIAVALHPTLLGQTSLSAKIQVFADRNDVASHITPQDIANLFTQYTDTLSSKTRDDEDTAQTGFMVLGSILSKKLAKNPNDQALVKIAVNSELYKTLDVSTRALVDKAVPKFAASKQDAAQIIKKTHVKAAQHDSQRAFELARLMAAPQELTKQPARLQVMQIKAALSPEHVQHFMDAAKQARTASSSKGVDQDVLLVHGLENALKQLQKSEILRALKQSDIDALKASYDAVPALRERGEQIVKTLEKEKRQQEVVDSLSAFFQTGQFNKATESARIGMIKQMLEPGMFGKADAKTKNMVLMYTAKPDFLKNLQIKEINTLFDMYLAVGKEAQGNKQLAKTGQVVLERVMSDKVVYEQALKQGMTSRATKVVAGKTDAQKTQFLQKLLGSSRSRINAMQKKLDGLSPAQRKGFGVLAGALVVALIGAIIATVIVIEKNKESSKVDVKADATKSDQQIQPIDLDTVASLKALKGQQQGIEKMIAPAQQAIDKGSSRNVDGSSQGA